MSRVSVRIILLVATLNKLGILNGDIQNVQKKSINGIFCWTMSSVDCINAAVENLDEVTKNKRLKMPKKALTRMSSGYIPELDMTPELDADDTQFYQEIIGMLR